MKTLPRFLKDFWFVTPLVWAASLLACWLAFSRVSGWRPYTYEALAILSAFHLLIIVLRQYRRIRTEHNLENLFQRQVDRSLVSRGQVLDHQVLRDRLEHALALLRAQRSKGAGSDGLHDVPWYLVIGRSGAGKTSLLSRSGLSTILANGMGEHDTALSHETVSQAAPGTSHCDWYLSPEAVMIDTGSRYLCDEQSAVEFGAFLRLLEKQRGKAAISGLVLVVSLPELLTASVAGHRELAAQLVARVEGYADSLQVCPPIYLVLSKTDALPGFAQAFDGLDSIQRQKPLGMTFEVGACQGENVRAVLNAELANLQQYIQLHVDARITALGEEVDSALLSFPNYFAELSAALQELLEPFTSSGARPTPLLVRGLYFTSALQTSDQLRPVYEEGIAETFALVAEREPVESPSSDAGRMTSRSYFITDTFRRVLFADRDLALHHWRANRSPKLKPAIIGLAVAVGVAVIAWQGLAFANNRQWLEALYLPLDTLRLAPDRDERLASMEGLELLRRPFAALAERRAKGLQPVLGGGPYHRDDLYESLQGAYLRQLRRQALEPIALRLEAQLREFNGFAVPLEHRVDPIQADAVISAYDALKLYLMLTEPQAHSETSFVAAALPAAWARTARELNPLSDQAIHANTSIYLRLMAAGQAPSVPLNDQLVSETRQRLKSLMIASSLVDREYLRLQLEASRQFPALGLADLVPPPGRTLLAGDAMVPAMFTRQGWDTFVKPELIKLVSDNLQSETDWVLDGDHGGSVVRKANFVRDFMMRYKRDYAEAWYRLMNSVSVRPFSDMATAINRLSLLSDVQNAPVKALLAAVDEHTQWDRPAPRSAVPVGLPADDGFWNKVSGLFDAQEAAPSLATSPLPAVDDGNLAEQFEPIARLFTTENAEGADNTVMDRYLAALRKLKVRLNNIHRSQDVGKSSKQLISETLEGQPSEITTVRNYVEATVDISQGELSSALQGLFTLPIRYTWETLRKPAGEHISTAWTQQIVKPWDDVLAHRYPIANGSDNEASVKDLQRFVDPHTGLLPTFKRNEIGNLAGGEGLGVASPKAAPLVNPGLLSNIDRASALGQVIASLSDRENGFEIMLQPSPYYTDILLTLDGQVQHYRNGKPSWIRFSWPVATTTPGARLEAITLTGERITVFDYPGRWGLLRMSDSARVADLDRVQQRMSWTTVNGPVSLVVRNYGGVKLTDLGNVKNLGSLSMAEGSSK
ncbi:type VI secretion system membrane subunit TssM [Pseudomonas japonica]|uniref:type VI secretion system membrane subunit TssM n=1 Tax=Pseudomonas japonica TaxID=256466 RepID=UPI0015E277B1|nr:type VI secretion system membrane subunit TssM [Pseudomonas japonica]MBA1245060.1 type VI secretion system membrane subunit TssM [Pseudomonas japonica]